MKAINSTPFFWYPIQSIQWISQSSWKHTIFRLFCPKFPGLKLSSPSSENVRAYWNRWRRRGVRGWWWWLCQLQPTTRYIPILPLIKHTQNTNLTSPRWRRSHWPVKHYRAADTPREASNLQSVQRGPEWRWATRWGAVVAMRHYICLWQMNISLERNNQQTAWLIFELYYNEIFSYISRWSCY